MEPARHLAGFVPAGELLRFGFALVVHWTEPDGWRPYLGARLLGYYNPGAESGSRNRQDSAPLSRYSGDPIET